MTNISRIICVLLMTPLVVFANTTAPGTWQESYYSQTGYFLMVADSLVIPAMIFIGPVIALISLVRRFLAKGDLLKIKNAYRLMALGFGISSLGVATWAVLNVLFAPVFF